MEFKERNQRNKSKNKNYSDRFIYSYSKKQKKSENFNDGFSQGKNNEVQKGKKDVEKVTLSMWVPKHRLS